jgi:hypothetical protein
MMADLKYASPDAGQFSRLGQENLDEQSSIKHGHGQWKPWRRCKVLGLNVHGKKTIIISQSHFLLPLTILDFGAITKTPKRGTIKTEEIS